MIDFFNKIFNKQARQKAKLLHPEYAYLFDEATNDEWICLDLEMTGLNAKTDYILSVGAVKIIRENDQFSLQVGEGLSIICHPPIMPTQESIVVHGLRPIDVENGISYEQMLPILLNFIGNRPIVGFCTQMDITFVNALARPFLGVNLPNKLLDVSLMEQQIRQKRNKNPDMIVERRHLNDLLIQYDIPLLPAHDAFNDAVMTAMLFCKLQAQMPKS